MAIGVPFKLKTSDSDFQDFSSTEENYLAFEVGRQYAIYDSSKGGSLGFDSSGGRAVGTLTNTTYDSSIGAHVNVTLTSTSTNIYQNLSTADSVGASLHRIPVYQNDSSGQFVIREFNDSDRNTLADRLNSRIFTSDYPGSYKLGSSAPSGDYSIALSNVMTDTRSGDSSGNTVQYNIYQRKTMTSPTQTLPFAVKRADGDSGTYQGLQLMTDSQIGHTLAEIGRNRITGGDSNGDYQVGSYLIRNSIQGAPTASGTWVAKGTATDTRLTETETNFTLISTQNFAGDFTGNFTSEFTNNFTNIFTGNVETDFTRNSTAGRASNFTRNSTNTFTRNSTDTFTRTSTRDSIQNFTGDFVGNFTGDFLGNYVGDFVGSSQYGYFSSGSPYHDGSERQYDNPTNTNSYYVTTTDFVSYQFQWNGSNIGSGSSLSNPIFIRPGDGFDYYLGDFWQSITLFGSTTFYYYIYRKPQGSTGEVSGESTNYQRTSTRISTNTFTRTSTQAFAGNFLGNFLGNFTGDFTGNFTGDFTGDFIDTFTGDFTGNFIGGVSTDFTGDFTGNFTGNFETDRASNFTGNFVGDYTGLLLGGSSTNIETFTLYVRTA